LTKDQLLSLDGQELLQNSHFFSYQKVAHSLKCQSIVSFPIFWIIPWFSAMLGFGGINPHEVTKPISQPITPPATKPITPPTTRPITPPITKPKAETPELPVKPPIDEIRTWTDASGGFKTKATYKGIAGGNVSLLKTTGETITIPFERLSADDQKWVKAVEGEP
jgi:hypothetical protein